MESILLQHSQLILLNHSESQILYGSIIKNYFFGNFPGSPVVKAPVFDTGGTGSIPGQGTKIPHATQNDPDAGKD